jgi:TolB-like protein/DNA-binding SARP family transcriptional activator/Tfp pilus assembly protein PilF
MLQPPKPPEVPRVSLFLLGGFRLTLSDQRVVVSSRKGCALVAYLAMQPDFRAGRERLATLLWGDRSDELARQSLRQCLSSLRRALPASVGSLLELQPNSIGLNIDLLVDARDFAALADSDDLEALSRACDLYRGPFLSDVHVDTEPFAEWVAIERERLECAAMRALAGFARQAGMRGEGSRAIAAVERLLAIDPLREEWQRLALELYAGHRGRDAALMHADRVVDLIRRELDVDVEPATRALIDGIRSGAVATAVPAPIAATSAPAAMSDVTDRVRSVADTSPPAWWSRPLAAILPTLAATALFVIGAWVVRDNPPSLWGGPPALKAALHRSDDGPAWSSPMALRDPATETSALAARGITALMVWPLEALGREEADQRLADGLTDDLTNSLSRFPQLRVISRMTAFSYRGRGADAAAVGADLGVRFIVEGSVRTIGEKIHVNVALIETGTRMQLWGDRFERDDAERSAVQNEIVARIGRELDVEVAAAQSGAPSHERASDTGVSELLAKGRMAQFRGPQEKNLKEARAYFAGALAREPGLVPALVGVAIPEVMGALNYVFDAAPSLARAATFVRRAAQIEPDSPDVQFWTGMIHKGRNEQASALRALQRTVELNPSFTPAYAQTGSILTEMGRYDEAMAPIVYAMRLSPNDPSMNIWMLLAGRAEIENGHLAAALDYLRRAAELVPNNPNVRLCLAATYALLDDRANAVAQIGEFKRLSARGVAEQSRLRDQLGDTGKRGRRLFQGVRLALAMAS